MDFNNMIENINYHISSFKCIKSYTSELDNIFSKPFSAENTQDDIEKSREFILKLINEDIAPFAQKAVIKKWSEKAFEYFHDLKDDIYSNDETYSNNEIYPVFFFISLFGSDELIGYKSSIMCEYIRYIAEYVFAHQKSICKRCLNNQKIPKSKVYDKFRLELNYLKRQKNKSLSIAFLYVIGLIITLLIGIHTGKLISTKDNNTPPPKSTVSDVSKSSQSSVHSTKNESSLKGQTSAKEDVTSKNSEDPNEQADTSKNESDISEDTDTSGNEDDTSKETDASENENDTGEETDVPEDENSSDEEQNTSEYYYQN